MKLTAITGKRKATRLINQFRRIFTSSEQHERSVGNPSSTSACKIHVHRDLGIWVVLDDGNGSQTWHVFGALNEQFDNESATLGHVCQINFSYTGDTGRVAGLFASDGGGRTYVTHTGRVGGGKPGIGMNAFLAYVAEHAPGIRTAEVDGAGPSARLVLGDLDAPGFPTKIAKFVRLVEAFKAHVDGREAPAGILPGPSNARGQGYERDPEVRRAIELHAMNFVEAHYIGQKYSVRTVSNKPGELDLQCTRRGVTIHVEVKGTTGGGDSVELTAAEVERARTSDLRVDLAVLSEITVDRAQKPPRASGGTLYVYKNFNPDDHTLTPTRHRCKLDHSHGHPG